MKNDTLKFLIKFFVIVLIWYSIITFISWNPFWFIDYWLGRLAVIVLLIISIIGALEEY